MKALRSALRDGKRSQRGSVLSGVLIITAFIAIISAALTTELSDNFLLSRVLQNRVQSEATINSATELAISQLQSTPVSAGCPGLSASTLNGLTAAVSYIGCKPVVDSRSPQFLQVASSGAITSDGTQVNLARAGLDVYVVGDSAGNVYQFGFGSSAPAWRQQVAGNVSGPPVTVPDYSGNSGDLVDLVPLSASSNSPSQCQAGGCVAALSQDAGSPPDSICYMAANGPVVMPPALGVNNPTTAFFGDQTGALFAYDTTSGGNCAQRASAPPTGQAIVGGLLVFAGPTTGSSLSDEIYAMTSDGSSTWLRQYVYTSKKSQSPSISQVAASRLVAPDATGLTADGSTLPARVAITFAGGDVQIVRLQSNFGLSYLAVAQFTSDFLAPPQWCHCPGGDQIAVAGADGSMYLLGPTLAVEASLAAGGAAITTRPASDSVGDWFFGAADGYLHEVQQPGGLGQLIQVAAYGPLGGAIGSAVQAGACPAGICLYTGSPAGAYLVKLDARDAIFSACLASSPQACSGTNPRLWASVEVGATGSPQTVHVEGWSYYSG